MEIIVKIKNERERVWLARLVSNYRVFHILATLVKKADLIKLLLTNQPRARHHMIMKAAMSRDRDWCAGARACTYANAYCSCMLHRFTRSLSNQKAMPMCACVLDSYQVQGACWVKNVHVECS